MQQESLNLLKEESLNLLRSQKWKDLQETVTKKHSVAIFETDQPSAGNIWLTGEQKQVAQVDKELENFVRLNTIIQDPVQIQ